MSMFFSLFLFHIYILLIILLLVILIVQMTPQYIEAVYVHILLLVHSLFSSTYYMYYMMIITIVDCPDDTAVH